MTKDPKCAEIFGTYKNIVGTIELVQDKTAKSLESQRREICKILDARLNLINKKFKKERAKEGADSADFHQREKELNDHLETMTQIAQRIDNENRELIKKNAELKIEFKSQENDQELLFKQIIQQKKENKTNREELDRVKTIAEELEKKMKEEEKVEQDMEEAANNTK